MQKTTFAVEIFIYDDASTDKTASIVKEYVNNYPNLFKTKLMKNNQYSRNGFQAFFKYLSKQKGKFIAICEGDDYWIKKNKLQKQVKLFQKNPKAEFCGSRCLVVKEHNKNIVRIEPKASKSKIKSLTPKDYIKGSLFMRMPTRLIKKTAFTRFYKKLSGKKGGTGDWILFLYFAVESFISGQKLLFIDEPLAVYREHQNGMWTGSDTIKKEILSVEDLIVIISLTKNREARKILINRKKGYLISLAKNPLLSIPKRISYWLQGVICDIIIIKESAFSILKL